MPKTNDNPVRASLAAAIIASDSAARAAQKAADAVTSGKRMVTKAETALADAQADLEAAKLASADKLALALAEGADAPPPQAADTVRARLRVTDAEDNLSALTVALERLKADAAKAEDAYARAQKHRDACIKNVVGIEDINSLIAKAEASKQALENAQLELRYIKYNLSSDGSDLHKRVVDYLGCVIWRNEQVTEDTNPVIAPWIKLKERLATDADASIPA